MNRSLTRLATVLTLTIGALTAAPETAPAYTPRPVVTEGHGWKLLAPAITHIDRQPWTIAFHDSTSRTKLTPYLRHTAAELSRYLGVPVTVTTRIVPVTQGVCVRGHVISYRYMSKPNPDRPNQSFTGACGNSRRAADGAYVFINSDYWDPGRRFSESTRMNVIWHESAHAVGLAHPTTCPYDANGLQPLMCANTYSDLRTRRYSTFEARGFLRLRMNRPLL